MKTQQFSTQCIDWLFPMCFTRNRVSLFLLDGLNGNLYTSQGSHGKCSGGALPFCRKLFKWNLMFLKEYFIPVSETFSLSLMLLHISSD